MPCGPHNGAGFLFIPDLTNKATGAVLVVLIVLYVGTQLASSLMMSSPTMDKTQRQIMLVMPLFFVIFIINFPAGVIVYWITTNTWTIGQQYIVRRRLGPIGPPVAAATGGSDGAASAKPERARPAKEQRPGQEEWLGGRRRSRSSSRRHRRCRSGEPAVARRTAARPDQGQGGCCSGGRFRTARRTPTAA